MIQKRLIDVESLIAVKDNCFGINIHLKGQLLIIDFLINSCD